MPIDVDTRERINKALELARRQGRDVAETLHLFGLVLTPQLEQKIKVEAMRALHREIVSWRPVEFLRRKFSAHHSASPADLYSCMVEFIEEYIAAMEKRS